MVGAADVEQNIGAPRQTLFHASAVSGLAWLPEDTEDNLLTSHYLLLLTPEEKEAAGMHVSVTTPDCTSSFYRYLSEQVHVLYTRRHALVLPRHLLVWNWRGAADLVVADTLCGDASPPGVGLCTY